MHGVWGLGNLLIACLNTDIPAALKFKLDSSLTQISGVALPLIEDSDKMLPGCLRTLGLLALHCSEYHSVGIVNGETSICVKH